LYFRGDHIGIDRVSEVVRAAVNYGVIEKGGAWYTVGEKRLQGEEAVISYLRDNPDVMNEIRTLTSQVKNG
jgi:recombination protein RecA